MLKTAVVILNFNGKSFLEKFLPNVIANSPSNSVFVADNGSTDDSISFLEKNFPEVSLINIPKNLGYTGGYNFALDKVKAKYFVLLNSDVETTNGWLLGMEKIADTHENIAIIQPKLLDFNNKEVFEYAGAAGGFVDVLGYPYCRGRIFDHLEADNGQFDNLTSSIFWASGACLFIRSSVFNELNGFDEHLFAHMEEIDLCWRAQNVGFKVHYCADSTVFHVGGGTLHKSNPFKTYLNFRNNLVLLYKNLPIKYLFFILFFRLVLDGVSGLRFLIRGDFRDFLAVLKAHFSFYALLPSLKREKYFEGFNNLTKISIVWQYFIKGKKTFLELY